MFFEQDCIAFQILDVLYLEQKDFKAYNQPRKFDALSFRYRADTLVEYPGGQLEFSDNSVGFFPAGIGYTRAVKTDTLIAVHFHLLSDRSDRIEQFLPENPGKYQLLRAQGRRRAALRLRGVGERRVALVPRRPACESLASRGEMTS